MASLSSSSGMAAPSVQKMRVPGANGSNGAHGAHDAPRSENGYGPNAQQQQAIEQTEGPLLIIAGPGSGKTYTLVERIVHLITEKGATPESLFVVTFTDKAAQELTTRISNRLNALGIRFNLNEMYLGTFHSICLRWLEEYREFTRLKRNFVLMDQFDQHFFLYRSLSQYEDIEGIDLVIGEAGKSNWHRSEQLLKWVNMVSEEALEASALLQAPDAAVRALGACYQRYHQQLEEENALDFSTIQYEALKLLRGQPKVVRELREKIAYLMVDEYQDTNTIQERILMLLAGEQPNLCVVGDDDQGLYRFRGATIRNILEFPRNFEDGLCQQVRLTVNYRSHPDIIGFYNGWMEEQDWEADGQIFRYPKRIAPQEGSFPQVPAVVRVGAPSEHLWHQEVLAFLHRLKADGHLKDWNQVAFLFKSVKNDKAVGLARFLEEQGIAVYSPRSNQFFDREEIRLMIGALIFLFPQFVEVRKWRADAELGIWDYYDQSCFAAFADALRKPENADMLRWARAAARRHAVMTENQNYAFSGLFYELLRFPMFSRYLGEERLKGGLMDSRAMRNLAIFSQLLGKFEYLYRLSVLTPEYLDKSLRDLFNQFIRYLKDGGIDEYEDEAEYAPSGCVSFLTIHQSKGLEFPVVIVGSLESVPRKQHSDLDELLAGGYLSKPVFEPLELTKFYDFRRLYYTAFSRAQNLLVLTALENREKGKKVPSRFFSELYDRAVNWRDPRFRPEAVPLAMVKEVNLKREYSFTSHLTLFENCAEQYRFFKELAFAPVRTSPILFGTLVHQTIEDIHKAVLRGEEHRLSEAQIGHWFDTNYAYLTKRERVYLAEPQKRIALGHVLRYFRRQNGDWSRIRETEVDVSLVKDDYILKGTIDLIRGEGNTVELVDFKSEKKLDVNAPKDRPKLDRYRRQLEVYAHLVEERTGQKVSKTHLYYTSEESGNPTITFPKDRRAIEQTVETFDLVVGRIERKDFTLAERPATLCKECDMRHYCDAKNWKFRGQG